MSGFGGKPAEHTQEGLKGIRDTGLEEVRLRAFLGHAWRTPKGFYGWLVTVDHKLIGRRYIVSAFLFLILAGLSALAMRFQLAQPEAGHIGPDLYNQLFTMHGTTMMFCSPCR